ncbi:hypothetical protein Gotri_012607 [Gossypium trilobum]|uniref:Uncharacterized protein n=1 Tax=Gossypium trilobum TaxID=34281 RepID=A0A7J9DQX7_9ROSI|nr:hypothetical protein [Gossypium trilobum]
MADDEDPMQFNNFIGTFVEYDAKQVNRGFKNFMRVRVQIDVADLDIAISFCPSSLLNGVGEMELGWDLSLKASSRRANTTTGVWLKEEDNGDFFGNNIRLRKKGSDCRDGNQSRQHDNFCLKINPILGFNLEGNQFQNDCHKERGGDSGGNDLIEEDLEEDPTKILMEGKERVSQTVSHVPKPLDSMEHANERKNASQLLISTTTIGQASRKQ